MHVYVYVRAGMCVPFLRMSICPVRKKCTNGDSDICGDSNVCGDRNISGDRDVGGDRDIGGDRYIGGVGGGRYIGDDSDGDNNGKGRGTVQ